MSSLALLWLVSAPAAQGPTFATTSSWPAARYAHAMAYDEGRARTVLFGGVDAGGGMFGDTWEWQGDQWIRHLPATSPAARHGHALAYDPLRGVTVLFGGQGQSGMLADTWEWDGRNWTQVLTPNAPTARAEHSMAVHVNTAANTSRIVLYGGLQVGNGYPTGTWLYDGANWALFNAAPQPSARKNSAMAWSPLRGTTVMVAGYLGGATLSDVWSWNGQGWLQLPNGPTIHSHAMAFDEPGGSFTTRGGLNGTTPLLVAYDGAHTAPNSVVWSSYSTSTAGGVHVPATAHLSACAFDSRRNRTVAFGGLTSGGPSDQLAERSSPNGAWQARPSAPPYNPPRRIHSAMAWHAGENMAVAFGGLDPWATSPTTYADTLLYDPAGWASLSWPPNTALPPARRGHAMVYVSRPGPTYPAGVMLHGGYDDATGSRRNDLWMLHRSPSNPGWQWRSLLLWPSHVPARSDHAMAYDSVRDRVVIFGGYSNVGPIADTAEVRDMTSLYSTVSLIATNGSPGPRYSHAMVYDPRRQRTVLFGGADYFGFFLRDTWEYNGATATWTRVATSGPEARVNHEMVYDEARGVVVLIGGRRLYAPQLLEDVWEFDGQGWRQRTWTTSSPTPREGAAMTWDPNRRRVLLFGGSQHDTATWSYIADNDRFASGMQGGSTELRCTKFPVAGRTTGFTFPSPIGFGWLAVETFPAPAPLRFLDPPLTCGSRGLLYSLQPLVANAPGTPARLSFGLPLGMAGWGLTVQGLAMEVVGGSACFRLTDPLAVTVAAP